MTDETTTETMSETSQQDDTELYRRAFCDECGNVTKATTAGLANSVKCVDCQPTPSNL